MIFHRVSRVYFYNAVQETKAAAKRNGQTYGRTTEYHADRIVMSRNVNGIPCLQRVKRDGQLPKFYQLR